MSMRHTYLIFACWSALQRLTCLHPSSNPPSESLSDPIIGSTHMSPWFSGMCASCAMTSPSHLAGSCTVTDNGEGLLHLLSTLLNALHGWGKWPVFTFRMIDGFDRATLTGVEVGNAFGDNNAFPAMDADCPWVKVAVMVASSFKAFDGMLHHTTVLCPAVGTIEECGGVWGRHVKNLTRALWIDLFDTLFSKVFASAVGLVGWAAAQCVGVDMFFTIPDAKGTVGAEIFGAPVQSCLVMGPVIPKFISGLWGHQWDLAKAACKQVTKVGVFSLSSGCFLW